MRCHSRACRDRGAVLSRLLLDTTFLVDAERAGNDLDRMIRDEDDVAIAAISVAELSVGVEPPRAEPTAAAATFSTVS